MEVRLLGPVELVGDDGAVVAVGGPKERALLAVLACHRDQVVSDDRLVDALWGDLPPRTAARTLQSYLSRLRKTVPVESAPGGWLLALPPAALDVARVETLGEKGRAAFERRDYLGAALAFADALRCWRGRPLDEFADLSWAIVEASRLEELHQTIVEQRADAELACGRHAELVGELEAVCRAHPLRERAWGQLMIALYRSGRQAESLRVYQDLRKTLGEELGIEPSPALARLEQQILVQDPALEWRPAPVEDQPAQPTVEWAEPVATPFPSFLVALAEATFVGRDPELETLAQTWKLARTGHRQVVLIAGEPGIGKTTLAARAAVAAGEQGATVLFGRCDEQSLLAFQPFVEAIGSYVDAALPAHLRSLLGPQAADLALLLPNVGRRLPEVAAVVGIGAETERYRIFDAVATFFASLSRDAPVVLVLDDLHWADRPTLGLFRHLIRRSNDVPLLILGSYRDTDLVRTHPMAETLVDLRRADLVARLPLRGLSAADVLKLVTGASTPEPEDEQLAEALWAETEGSPLFIREIVRHLEETDAAFRDEKGRLLPRRRIDQLGIPEGLREVLGRRLSRLSDAANVALRTGSVLGRQVRLDVLELVTDLTSEQLLDALDEATAAGVIEEVPGAVGRWSYTHALVRHALYEELSLSRRVRLHQRVGEALEVLEPGDGPQLAELAYHFSQAAVSGTADKAIAYAWQAGERAVTLAAHEQAARHFAGALEVAEDAGLDAELRADLLLAQADAEMRAGDAAVARTTFERAVALIGKASPERLGRAALGYAGAGIRPIWVDMFLVNERAVGLLEAALAELPEEDSELRARLLACLAQELYFQDGSEARRDELSAAALGMVRRLGEPRSLAYVLAARTLAMVGPGHADEVWENATELLALSRQLGDREIEAHALRLRFAFMPGGNHSLPTADLERWEALAEELKDPSAAWIDQWIRAMMASLEGRFGDAESLITEAFRRGHELHDRNAFGAGGLLMTMLRLYQGRVAEALTPLAVCKDVYPAVNPWADAVLAGSYAEIGMDDEARSYMAGVDPGEALSVPGNIAWPVAMAFLGRASYRLGDVAMADKVYRLLLPYLESTGLFMSMGTGSLHLAAALTAVTTGNPENAARHFDAALARNARNNWAPAVAETKVHYARFLVSQDLERSRERALALLDEALASARELGMAAVAREADELRAGLLGLTTDAVPRGRRIVSRRDRARAKLTSGGRAAVARWTRGISDESLVRRFGSNVAQRAFFTAVARSFQPAMAFGFSGDVVLELRPPDDGPDPAAADWWTIEIRARKASARRGRSDEPAVTVHARLADFVRMGSGELHPVRAVIENRLDVEGDFMLAARFPDMFGVVEPVEELAQSAAK